MGSAPEVALAADFAPATREQWRGLVGGVLAKSGAATDDPELALATSTYDGFELRPLYTAEDLPGGFDWNAPVRSNGATIGWDVRQRYADSDPARVNAAILADLTNGATSAWIKIGVGALAVSDLARALEGVYLDLAPIALDAGSATSGAAAALLALAAEQGASVELAGSLGLDPIGTRARTGAAVDLSEVTEIAGQARSHPRLAAITVDGTVFHDAGGSDAQELGLVIASVVEYVRVLTDAGWPVDEAFAQLECRYAVTADQFASIAKLRAARRIWARVTELSGVTGVAQRQHATGSRAMLTQRDPWVNLLRGTVACFAAAVGGAGTITVEPFDSAIGLPDEFARRIARNTQSILHDESSLGRVTDPAAGSWYVEARTDALANAAWSIFVDVERAGGALAALDNGHTRGLLGATQGARADAVAHRREPITGVSEFAFPDEEPVSRAPYPVVGTEPLLWPHRNAEVFELFRDRADAAPTRPVVFLAALGSVAAYTGRVDFTRNLFNAGGIDSVVGEGGIAELVAAFTAAGSKLACLCSSDSIYAERADETTAALVAAGATEVWVAGRDLYRDGDAIEVLARAFTVLGVA